MVFLQAKRNACVCLSLLMFFSFALFSLVCLFVVALRLREAEATEAPTPPQRQMWNLEEGVTSTIHFSIMFHH